MKRGMISNARMRRKMRRSRSTIRFLRAAIQKPGALSRQLGIPEEKNIPITLINKIIKSKAGDRIRNPTKIGKRFIKVTRLLERRAILAKTLKKISKRRKRKK